MRSVGAGLDRGILTQVDVAMRVGIEHGRQAQRRGMVSNCCWVTSVLGKEQVVGGVRRSVGTAKHG